MILKPFVACQTWNLKPLGLEIAQGLFGGLTLASMGIGGTAPPLLKVIFVVNQRVGYYALPT